MIPYQHHGVAIFRSALYMTNSTIIDAGDAVVLVDPSWLPDEVMSIRRYVDGILGERPLYLVFTHSHYDHIIGAGAFPEAITVASQALADREDFQEPLNQIGDFDDQWYLERPYPILYPTIQYAIENPAVVQQGRMKLHVLPAPGHSPCSIFVLEESTGTLFAGDYLSDVEIPNIYFSSIHYEASLAQLEPLLESRQVQRLVPGHGHVADSPTEIRRRIEESRHYIAEVRRAVTQQDAAALAALSSTFAFPKMMGHYHAINAAVIAQEQGLAVPGEDNV